MDTETRAGRFLEQSYGEAVTKYKAIMVQPDFAAFQKTPWDSRMIFLT